LVIVAVTWMPSITIWPPPRLTRPSLDSPLVTNALVLGSRLVKVDDSSSDSPSPDDDADDAASDRDGVPAPRAVGDGPVGSGGAGTGGVGTGGVGTGGVGNPPRGAVGAVTVATGVVTAGVGVVTVAIGFLTVREPVGVFGLRRPCHFAFHAASVCRSRPSNPLGAAIALGTPGPLKPLEASEASAVAL
jgi:hypothetical protein